MEFFNVTSVKISNLTYLGRLTNKELGKNRNGDLLVDLYRILKRWKYYFSQLLNVHKLLMSGNENTYVEALAL
jgi:hypothetical protein